MRNLNFFLSKITLLTWMVSIGLTSCNQNQQVILNNQANQAEISDSSGKKIQLSIWTKFMPDSGAVKGVETILKDTPSSLVAGKPFTMITNVSKPTITIYSPKIKNTGAAVIVFPGGGYWDLAIDLEGSEICEWLASSVLRAYF